jgi:hypothetical protein
MKLYDLEQEVQELDAALEAAAQKGPPKGLSPDELEAWEAERADYLEALHVYGQQLEAEFSAKVGDWVRVYFSRKRLGEAAEAEQKRLLALQRTSEHAAERVKQTLLDVMGRLGLAKFPAGEFKLSVGNNGGNPVMEWDQETPPPLELAQPVAVPPSLLVEVLRRAVAPLTPEQLEAVGLSPLMTDAELLLCFGVTPEGLAPDRGKILEQFKATGEVPPGFRAVRGIHLRIS